MYVNAVAKVPVYGRIDFSAWVVLYSGSPLITLQKINLDVPGS